MLLLLFYTLVIFVPDLELVLGQCDRTPSQYLTATSSEEFIEETKYVNSDCEWTIDSTGHVEINITEWSLYKDELCAEDSLIVYDGADPNALVIARLCGQGSALILISSNQIARVRYKTGNRNIGRGFRMSFRTRSTLPECSYQWPTRRYLVATETSQTITSANYPHNYHENYKEEWVIIKPSSSSPLAIVIEDVDIEESRNCGYDYLAIHDGKCYTDKKKALLCGTEKYSLTLTGNQYALIRFKSDSGSTGRGFKLNYYVGTVEEEKEDTKTLHAILIGLIAACIVIIFLLASAKIYMHCFTKQKIRPNQAQLHNRRAVLEAQVRRGPNGSRLNRLLTAQSIHAEATRYVNNSNTSDHDSRFSTFEISSSQESGAGLVYQNGMLCPPSYSTLFNHAEEPFTPTAPPDDTDMAPPPYPGSPDIIKSEGQGQVVSVGHCSPVREGVKESERLADVETVSDSPYSNSGLDQNST